MKMSELAVGLSSGVSFSSPASALSPRDNPTAAAAASEDLRN
jgi:hypothetical protein